MKKKWTLFLATLLFTVAVYCAVVGYLNYQLWVSSKESSEQSVRFDVTGAFTVTVDPPGRSFFRPGGVLKIYLSRSGVPAGADELSAGVGSLRVVDHEGRICLEESFDESMGFARGRYYSLSREFDTSRGGPYQIYFEITEPFTDLEGISQTLSASHFISGSEPLLHFFQFCLAGLSLCLSLVLIWRVSAANKASRSDVDSEQSASL